MPFSIQVQSVIYNNDPAALMRTLRSFAFARKKDQCRAAQVEKCTVFYGDASAAPVFDERQVEAIAAEFAECFEFRYRFFMENSGTSRGHNLLAEGCESDLLFLMNPDLLVTADFFERMLAPFMDESLDVGQVEARQTPIEHPKLYDTKTGETAWSSGACTLIPTKLFHQLGGYDEQSFFLYCDDVDLSWRVRLLGKQVVYQAAAPVFHSKQVTNTARWIASSTEEYYTAEAALMMAYKWSHNRRWKRLLRIFERSEDNNQQKATTAFRERLAKGDLPKQIDRQHKIARFIDNIYTEHRFDI